MKTRMKIIKELKPNSSFVESISVEGNIATVKMQGRDTLYHYLVDDVTKSAIKAIERHNVSAGTVFNRFIRKNPIAKTVYQ